MPALPPKDSNHVWKFVRLGGLDQVAIESASDLLSLESLDPKLWVALSCPVRGLEIDEKTLALVDSDGDGHIRIPELIAAVKWAAGLLKDPAALLAGAEEFPLSAIDDGKPEGRAAVESARWVLDRLSRAGASAISTADTADPVRLFDGAGVAGDGVIPAIAISDPAIRAAVEDIIGCRGADPGWNGRTGLTSAKAEEFFSEAESLAAEGEAEPTFLPYPGWAAQKSNSPVAGLGSSRIKEILASGAHAKLDELFARDRELAPQWEKVGTLDRLVRYHRDLRTLLNNFANFSDFYSRERTATFQAGTLFLDGRSCELCVRVDDPSAHSVLASMSQAYLAYLECRRPGGEIMKIAACFTQGDSDYLFVGRNGVFIDRRGRDWDATILKVIENPISIRQAFFLPYKKFLRFVESQWVKKAAAADNATASGQVAPAASKIDVGTVAAIGVAVGGLTAALGSVVVALKGHSPWVWIPACVLCLIVAISGPSILIAWFKLKQRNLGPILEANGWAVNGRVKINLPLGYALTERAVMPRNARRSFADPYSDRAGKLFRIVCVVLVLLLAAAIAARVFNIWPFGP